MAPEPRGVEPGMATDFRAEVGYGSYLDLDTLLTAQHPVSEPEHHDELLFIIQHQTSELWLKLVLHELRSAVALLQADRLRVALKRIARVKHIQRTLTDQWSVLATLTPTEYSEFRGFLGRASGFQSWQYRAFEFVLGNKDAATLAVHAHHPEGTRVLTELLEGPSLYDAFLGCLARQGHPVPARVLERDRTRPHTEDDELTEVLCAVYADAERHWDAYEACEELVDLEDAVQLWRFRHLTTVQRTIGLKTGTGGSSGVGFLRKALDVTFFPELYAVRSRIGR